MQVRSLEHNTQNQSCIYVNGVGEKQLRLQQTMLPTVHSASLYTYFHSDKFWKFQRLLLRSHDDDESVRSLCLAWSDVDRTGIIYGKYVFIIHFWVPGQTIAKEQCSSLLVL